MMPRILRTPAAAALQALPVEGWNKLFSAQPQLGQKIHKVAEILGLDTQEEIYARWLRVSDYAPLKTQSADAVLPVLFEGLDFSEKMMLWDTLIYLPCDILTKVDRATMATSLEGRAPLLDPRIFEYVWGLPLSAKIHNGRGKRLLRDVLARSVPRALFERPKQGFNIPVGEWLKGPLKDWASSLLTPSALGCTGLLDEASISKLWRAHCDGQGNHAPALWSVLMFQAWHARWM